MRVFLRYRAYLSVDSGVDLRVKRVFECVGVGGQITADSRKFFLRPVATEFLKIRHLLSPHEGQKITINLTHQIPSYFIHHTPLPVPS